MTRRLLLAALVALLGAASACSAQAGGIEVDAGAVPGTAADSGRPSIAVIGDSITEQSADELETAAARRGFDVDVDATAGFMTREKQDAAEAAAGRAPDAAVIALGTNDAVCQLTNALISGSCRYPGFTIADMEADLTTMAQTLGATTPCVVGVTAYFGEEVGEHHRVLVDRGLLAGIVDWRSFVLTDDSLRADGIGHLTTTGEAAYAEFVVDETARICGL